MGRVAELQKQIEEVTSAFRRGVLSPPSLRVATSDPLDIQSPVPFGVGCSHPILTYVKNQLSTNPASPVPFGVGCSHPVGVVTCQRIVTSESHQCLSAWGALTPISESVLKYSPKCHQCLSAWGALTP